MVSSKYSTINSKENNNNKKNPLYSGFSFVYKIGKNDFGLCSEDVISLIKDLNVLFSKIQGLVNQFTCNNSAIHPFVRRLINYNFSDFNKIYESDLLTVFGKIMLPF